MRLHDPLHDALHTHFNFSAFREGQKEIIQDLLSGQDVFGILPTGTGKSLCYQLTAKLLPGTTIVVSPLISLMIDQVNQLRANKYKDVVAITSFQSYEERRVILGKLSSFKLIYASPELLQKPQILSLFKQLNVSLFVIDEAHCISQWGHEFRPDYLRLDRVIEQLNHPIVLALSATATPDVQQDVFRALKRPNMIKHIHPMDRENIVLNVCKVENDQEKLTEVINILSSCHVPALVYFSSRRTTENISRLLSRSLTEKRIAFYHGGMDQLDRVSIQQQFMNDQLDIICCTNAFGMGIDKENIGLIIHYHLPSQLESFIQEIGRSGRDGRTSVSILLYGKYDEYLPKKIIDNELPTIEQISFIFKQLYKISQGNIDMPLERNEIINTFQVDEIQSRFIYYQLESNGIIKDNKVFYEKQHFRDVLLIMNQHRKERLLSKRGKLIEMIDWANEKKCLREKLYKKFQDNYQKPIGWCCSNCGFSIDKWYKLEVKSKKTVASNSWEDKLKSLLFIDKNNDTK